MGNRSTADKLEECIADIRELEDTLCYAQGAVQQLRADFSILWDVAYEMLERDDRFYELVHRRTGQTRVQVEKYFKKEQNG